MINLKNKLVLLVYVTLLSSLMNGQVKNFKTDIDLNNNTIDNVLSVNGVALYGGVNYFNGDAENLAIGYDALSNNSGNDNLAVGVHTLRNNTNNWQVAIGTNCMENASGGISSALGYSASQNNTGVFTSSVGAWALGANQGAGSNGFGAYALQNNKGESGNGVGKQVMKYNIGDYVSAFGEYSGYRNSGNDAVFYGKNSGEYNYGDNVSSIGNLALRFSIGNNAFGGGYNSLPYNEGDNNSALGYSAHSVFRSDMSKKVYFDYDVIDAVGNKITIPSHNLGVTNDVILVEFSEGTDNIGGLSAGYVKLLVIDDNILQTYFYAKGSYVGSSITAVNTGTGHSFTPQYVFENTTSIGALSEPTVSNQVMLGNQNVIEVATYGDFKAKMGGTGLILTTPDGLNEYRISIDNTGAIITTQL